MSAAAALSLLAGDGVTIHVDGPHLVARPADRLTQAHRDLIRAYRPALIALLSPKPEQPSFPRWSIRHADGAVASHDFTPPATLAEVRAWYPNALAIEPDNVDLAGAVLPARQTADSPGLPDPADRPVKLDGRPWVRCATCRDFQPSETTPATGLGLCRSQTHTSKTGPGHWPETLHACGAWRPLEP